MTQPNPPAGWYPDPSGRHERRYFDGQWTQHVSTRGVNSVDPWTAPPVAMGYSPGAPSTGRRSAKTTFAVAGAVVALAVGITLAVTLSGGGSNGGHGFCADARALRAEFPSSASITNKSQLAHAAAEFDTLAAESPSPQDAADLRYLARWVRSFVDGKNPTLAGQAQANAVAKRFDTYASKQCASAVSGG